MSVSPFFGIEMMMKIILASKSPRRRELVQLLNLSFRSQAADVDEDSIQTPNITTNVVARACLKGTASSRLNPSKDALILAADTAVAVDNIMLNKPGDRAEAFEMLNQLRQRTHYVHTGVALILPGGRVVKFLNTAVVTMRNYSDQEIYAYIDSGDPFDKAGAYAIQHPDFNPVRLLDGCYLSVMGLPVCQIIRTLTENKIKIDFDYKMVRAAHQNYIHCPDLLKLKSLITK